ncbi:uncharacterized protein TNCV_3368191 [Trichonephila clavipes]|nr:uncharacterized protein TNCV_3368191 [Trichonephila clavipes]
MSKYKCAVSGCKGLHNSLFHDSDELCSAVKNHTVGERERGIETNANPTRFEGIYLLILIKGVYNEYKWNTSADASVKTYKLASVTYGTVSAPFLATSTLKALVDEEKAEFPDAADVICNDSYMDDILSWESTLESAKNIKYAMGSKGGLSHIQRLVTESNSPD